MRLGSEGVSQHRLRLGLLLRKTHVCLAAVVGSIISAQTYCVRGEERIKWRSWMLIDGI